LRFQAQEPIEDDRHTGCDSTRLVDSKNIAPSALKRQILWALLWAFTGLIAHAVTLEWDRNPETNVTGYRIYVGRQSRVYDSVLDVANQTVATIAAPQGVSFYAVTAYNTDGLESDFSEEVSYAPPWSNSVPRAAADFYTTIRNVPRVVSMAAGVLMNDSDVDLQPLTAVLVSPPSDGTVLLAANGSFTYTPSQDFVGQDSFGYSATDGSLASAVVFVTINVAPDSSGQGCTNCFGNLQTFVATRSSEMQAVIAAQASVPTNVTCPKLGVLIFSAVSRVARTLNNAELNSVLASTAECLAWDIRNALVEKVSEVNALLPSLWSVTASNQAVAAERLLTSALANTNSLRQARLLSSAANGLLRVERSILAGDIAPQLLAGKSAHARIFLRSRLVPLTFQFAENSFTIEDTVGVVASGQYSFSRSAWNAGNLTLQFNQPALQFEAGQSTTMLLKFGRSRHRMMGAELKGYFTLQ
jgi:hypothetical protein